MLQQILKDMYVDPDVLEALSEEQKKILFLKMREEQVRRWKEREEKEEIEGRKENTPRAKKGSRKSVKWLLGHDGDVHVCVIGESEVEKSPKRLLSELRQNGSIIRIGNNSELLKNNQVDQNGIQLVFKKPEEMSDSSSTAPIPEDPKPACNLPSLSSHLQDPKDDSDDSGTAEDDLKDSLEEENSGSASDDLSDSGIFCRSHSSGSGLSITAIRSRPRDTQPSVNERLSVKEKPVTQESQEGEKDVSKAYSSPSLSVYGRRVALLRRNFGLTGSNGVPTGVKPPVPTKPAHLQRQSAATPQ